MDIEKYPPEGAKIEEYTVVLTFQAEIESHLDGRVFNYTFIEGALDLSLDGVTQRTPPITNVLSQFYDWSDQHTGCEKVLVTIRRNDILSVPARHQAPWHFT